MQAGAPATATGAAAMANDADAYFVDMLLRSDHPSTAGNDSPCNAPNFGRIFAHAVLHNDLPSADQAYLAQLVSAQKRV